MSIIKMDWKRDYALYSAVCQWFITGDIFYRDSAKNMIPLVAHGDYSDFEELCYKYLIEFPEDDFYKNKLLDTIRDITDRS